MEIRGHSLLTSTRGRGCRRRITWGSEHERPPVLVSCCPFVYRAPRQVQREVTAVAEGYLLKEGLVSVDYF